VDGWVEVLLGEPVVPHPAIATTSATVMAGLFRIADRI
jgi:hypothetical protein